MTELPHGRRGGAMGPAVKPVGKCRFVSECTFTSPPRPWLEPLAQKSGRSVGSPGGDNIIYYIAEPDRFSLMRRADSMAQIQLNCQMKCDLIGHHLSVPPPERRAISIVHELRVRLPVAKLGGQLVPVCAKGALRRCTLFDLEAVCPLTADACP